jgi:hypothetical protein
MLVHLCSQLITVKFTVISELAFLPLCPVQLQILILQIPKGMNDNRNTALHCRPINRYRYVAYRTARADNATAQFVTKNKQSYKQQHASFRFPKAKSNKNREMETKRKIHNWLNK